jgi:hypothetical protein
MWQKSTNRIRISVEETRQTWTPGLPLAGGDPARLDMLAGRR